MKKQHIKIIISIMSISTLLSSLTACKRGSNINKNQVAQQVIFDNEQLNIDDQSLTSQPYEESNQQVAQEENQNESQKNSNKPKIIIRSNKSSKKIQLSAPPIKLLEDSS